MKNESVVQTMQVKVEFFKAHGKWYTEEYIDWPTDINTGNWVPFNEALNGRLKEMVAICINSPFGYPIMRPAIFVNPNGDIGELVICPDGMVGRIESSWSTPQTIENRTCSVLRIDGNKTQRVLLSKLEKVLV